MIVQHRPEWHAESLCSQIGGDIFYPEKGESTAPARRICAMCPVMAECRQWALDHNETFGIWGGLTTKERQRLRRHHSAPTPFAA